ncbi:MAG: nucleoside deaminase [Merismopedia sp. SIO2A8]|nr:nucleoside deaminase [Merismopedia sp. SIO2A8]
MQTVIPPPLIQHPEYLVHYRWMSRAIALADQAGAADEVPVGAVVVGPDGTMLAEGENRRQRDHDPTAHAEVLALRQAGRSLHQWRLSGCVLYVTLEPCPMCAGAIIQSRIDTVVYGANDPKTGALRTVVNIPDGPSSNHHPQVIAGILATTCTMQLQTWFASRRP